MFLNFKSRILVFLTLFVGQLFAQTTCPAPNPVTNIPFFGPYTPQGLADYLNNQFKPQYEIDNPTITLGTFSWATVPTNKDEVWQFGIDRIRQMFYGTGIIIPLHPTAEFVAHCHSQCLNNAGILAHDCNGFGPMDRYCALVGPGLPPVCGFGPCWTSPLEVAATTAGFYNNFESSLYGIGAMMGDDGHSGNTWGHYQFLTRCNFMDYLGVGAENGYITVNNVNIGSGAACMVPTSCAAILPVELSKFQATAVGKMAELVWETEVELNCDGFEVQRSTNGRDWDAVGFVLSKNTENSTTNYSFLDESPIAGLNFYRLKQIDLDGSYEYSYVIPVKIESKSDLAVYPNPTSGIIQCTAEEGSKVQIYNSFGQLVRQDILNSKLMDVSELPSGVYTLFVLGQEGAVRFSRL